MVGKNAKKFLQGLVFSMQAQENSNTSAFVRTWSIVSQDFGQYNGQGNGAGLQTESWEQSTLDIISDITAIPEPDASFDAIMCIEVFEHIPEPVKAVNEFSRILKPGGILIITAPFCSLTHFAPYYFEVIKCVIE